MGPAGAGGTGLVVVGGARLVAVGTTGAGAAGLVVVGPTGFGCM